MASKACVHPFSRSQRAILNNMPPPPEVRLETAERSRDISSRAAGRNDSSDKPLGMTRHRSAE